MRRRDGNRFVGPVLLALTCTEGAVRLLSPRERVIEPSEVDPSRYFTDEELERGRRYVRPQIALAMARAAVELTAVGLAAPVLSRVLRGRLREPAPGGALAGAGLAVVTTIAPLPLAAVARRRSIAVGLITQSWRGWALDLVKETALGIGFAAGAGSLVMTLTRRYPRTWWLPAAGAGVAFGGLLQAVGPVLLDPIFNDYTPLPEGEAREDVLELARRAGIDVGEVYSVDASRRTTAANAYVTGLGPTKRVVLFDTLLDRYSRDEVRVVVAHELAHVRNRDVPRGVAFAALVSPAAAFAVQRLSWTFSRERDSPAALPVLALAGAFVTGAVGLMANRLSRSMERRADAYSLELSGSPEAFISFERAISLQNVADVDPPRWMSSLLATHPPTTERIGMALAYSDRASDGVRPAPAGRASEARPE